MNSENKNRQNIIVLCCCIVCVITAVVCVAVYMTSKKKTQSEAAKDRIIAYIDNEKITESQFKFFASIILNQEEDTVKKLLTDKEKSDKDELKKYTSNFTKEYIVRVLEAQKAGVTLTEDEEKALEKQFEEDYKNNKNIAGEELAKEDFYLYYYGISEAKYKEFWKNWFIIDKHTSIMESEADISEEKQQSAFAEYYNYLYSYTTSVIPFEVNAENTKEDLIQKANAVAEQIKAGADFTTLLKEHCKDEALLKNNGLSEFYPLYKNEQSQMYDFVRTSEIGEVGVVSDDYMVYVVRLDGIKDFEKLKGTDEMLEWTRIFYVSEKINNMMNSYKDKYSVVQAVYDEMDLSKLLQDSYDYWQSVWEGNS